jgi:hypothetical protein
MKHSEYVSIVKSYGTNALKNVLIKWAVSKLPFLASGFWNVLLVKLAMSIAKEAAEEAEMRVFFLHVDFRTNEQAKDFELAMIQNHKAQKEGTEDEKIKAEQNLVKALNSLVHLAK